MSNWVLLPGVTTLARMVAAVLQGENDRLHATLCGAPYDLRTEMVRLLEVRRRSGCRSWRGSGWADERVGQGHGTRAGPRPRGAGPGRCSSAVGMAGLPGEAGGLSVLALGDFGQCFGDARQEVGRDVVEDLAPGAGKVSGLSCLHGL